MAFHRVDCALAAGPDGKELHRHRMLGSRLPRPLTFLFIRRRHSDIQTSPIHHNGCGWTGYDVNFVFPFSFRRKSSVINSAGCPSQVVSRGAKHGPVLSCCLELAESNIPQLHYSSSKEAGAVPFARALLCNVRMRIHHISSPRVKCKCSGAMRERGSVAIPSPVVDGMPVAVP